MLLALTCARDLHRSTRRSLRSDGPRRAGASRLRPFVRGGRARRGSRPATAGPTGGRLRARSRSTSTRARVRLPPGVRIDLGGIGKGLAADLVSRGLVDRGARSALVSLGGDMRARGEVPDGAWQIPVEHPLDPTAVAFVHPLDDAALVSSTRAFRTLEARRPRRFITSSIRGPATRAARRSWP